MMGDKLRSGTGGSTGPMAGFGQELVTYGLDCCPTTAEQNNTRPEQVSVAASFLQFGFFKEGKYRCPFSCGLAGLVQYAG